MIFLKSPETFDDRLCYQVLVLSWPHGADDDDNYGGNLVYDGDDGDGHDHAWSLPWWSWSYDSG